MTDFSVVLDQVFNDEAPLAKSWMGTEIVGQIIFGGQIFKQYSDNGKLEDLALDDFVLPSTALAQFSRPKEIIKTKLLSAPGTVKELFSYGDWQIELLVRCINDSGRTIAPTAQEQLIQLLEFEKVLGPIRVIGEAFNQRKIHYLVIERMETLVKKGAPDTIDIRIRAVSDQVSPMEQK